MPKPLTHSELIERLQRRVLSHEGQGHRAFLLTEVGLGSRRADAISIGLWASRGQLLEGFEAKSTRGDWLREYEDHQKAEPLMAIVDRYWLVTNPDVLQPGELPESWGLLISNGRGRNLKVAKPAPKLRESGDSVGREVLVSLLRRLRALGEDERAEVYEQAREAAAQSVDFDRRRLEHENERLKRWTQEFEEGWDAFHRALGLDRWKWQPTVENLAFLGQVAEALRDGQEGLERLHRDVKHKEAAAADLVGQLNDALGDLGAAIYGRGQAA
jgi:hypothetical protein